VINYHTLFGKKVVTLPLDGDVIETGKEEKGLLEGDNREPSGSGKGSLLFFEKPLVRRVYKTSSQVTG
jgi:hypothetical protein